MVTKQVFIPSRGRWQGARTLTQNWHLEGFSVHWVVEPEEQEQYYHDIIIGKHDTPLTPPHCDLQTHIHPLPFNNGGIAASRAFCVRLAANQGYPAIVLADDDIKPAKKNANMGRLVESAVHSKVLGITARYSYHDLCLGGDNIRDRDDLILLPTGTFRLVALNVHNVLSLGNYDTGLEYAEDCDLFLRGLKAGYPWMVDLGTRSNSIGTRYQPGGMVDFVDAVKGPNYTAGVKKIAMRTKKRDWHYDLYDKYPEVVNDPERVKDWDKQNTIRIQWKKAYNLWLPGWEKWSALHGGHLVDYLLPHKVNHG